MKIHVSTGDTVAEKKEAFESAYNVALEENLVNKIRRVENAHDRCKNKESWSVINEVKENRWLLPLRARKSDSY